MKVLINEEQYILMKELFDDYQVDRMTNSVLNATGVRPDKEYKQVEKAININSLSPQWQEKFKKMTSEQTMEAIREFMSGAWGIGVAVALDAIGVGEIINPVVWILFLIYDCWLWFKKGAANWFNIIIDIIGAVTAGAQTKWGKMMLGKLGKYMSGTMESLVKGMAKETPQLFKWLSGITKFFTRIIAKVGTLFTESIPRLANKIPTISKGLYGLKSAVGGLRTALTKLAQLLEMEGANVAAHGAENLAVHGAEHAGEHGVADIAKHYGKHYAQHQIAHDAVSSLVGHGGHEVSRHIPKMVAQNKQVRKMVAQNKQVPKNKPILTTRNTGSQYPNKNIA